MRNTLRLMVRIAFVAAAIWSILASAWLFFTPMTVTVQQATSSSDGSSEPAETTIEERSWYQIQGAWGVAVLFIFAGLYTAGAAAAWKRRHLAATLVSLLAIGLTWLAGFSIGGYYLPAAVGVLIGLSLLLALQVGAGRELSQVTHDES